MNISQKNDFETKYKTMILCKALSLTDDYWVTNNKEEKWEDVNLRDNSLHESIAQIALSGKSLTITGHIRTPELTGQGAYAKAWYRQDGELYLYKAGTKNGNEVEKEVSASRILDCTNVPHLKYVKIIKDGKMCSRCKNLCSSNLAIVDADSVSSWCNRIGTSFDMFVKSIDANLFYQTIIVDYLIANRDRHGAN